MNKIQRILVTGSNKGIGYGIIEKLIQEKVHAHIYLTSRDLVAGQRSCQKLQEHYPSADNIQVVQLDITDKGSVAHLLEQLKREGPIDILFNNSGVGEFGDQSDPKLLTHTMGVNYHATRAFTEALLKEGLIADGGKIIIVSSGLGKFGNLPTTKPDYYKRLSQYRNGMTVDQLEALVAEYEQDLTATKDYAGWNKYIYSMSKLLISIYAYILSRSKEIVDRNIQVYTSTPGWCATDMGNLFGSPPKTYLEGAETPVFLSQFKDSVDLSVQGEYFADKKVETLDGHI